MRTLALATRLRSDGAECRFICRAHPGHLIKEINARGFPVDELPPASTPAAPAYCCEEMPAHADWLGAESIADALATRNALQGRLVDWLVVDHYALDATWERELHSSCRWMMVIDDLADRAHECDLLLDQGFGRVTEDYAQWVPQTCRLLLGTRYALQRPDFAALRTDSLQRRAYPRLGQILVSMGGVDQVDATGKVLDALDHSSLPLDCHVVVVMGGRAPWTEQVRARARSTRYPCEVKVNVAKMAQLVADSDLVIGAGGGMAWERCTLGVPSIIVVLAENQRRIAWALESAGAAWAIDELDSITEGLPKLLSTIDESSLDRASHSARRICDGAGCGRVAAVMVDVRCRVRAMQSSDLDMVLAWRNSEQVRRVMYTQNVITRDEHEAWFNRSMHDDDHHLLIMEEDGRPLGFVQLRCQREDGRAAEWGFYASPTAGPGAGGKLGRAALAHAFGVLGLREVRGQAIGYNERSIAFHRKLGFQAGTVGKAEYFDGKVHHDVHHFVLFEHDWRARQ